MDGIEFFKILSQDDEFCSELGRVVLAAGRLESLMIIQLGNESRLCKATLGQLVEHAKRHRNFDALLPHLDLLKTQRNYLTHNIYSLLSDRIEETILERHDLVEMDVLTYKNRAVDLANNLNGLANIVEKMQ